LDPTKSSCYTVLLAHVHLIAYLPIGAALGPTAALGRIHTIIRDCRTLQRTRNY